MSNPKILIKQVVIIDADSEFNKVKTDVLIEEGIITEIGDIASLDSYEIIDAEGCYLSIGWMDMRVNFCDPGDEHKETLTSGIEVAKSGGFTAVAVMPNTEPITDHKSQIEYIQNKSIGAGVKLWVVGALSLGAEGKELSEMYDMHVAGAIAFSDVDKPIAKSGLLVRALQYIQPFNSRVLVHCEDKSISAGGRMHEGNMSVSLGMKGIPPLAESIAIARDIEILRYTGGKLHISRVTTLQGVELIKKAKQEGLDITADVTIHHLIQSDESLHDFDTHFKLSPPLRSQEHINALIEAINTGVIDCIVSDHTPENIENKEVEFEYASPGVIGTQILYSLYQTYLSDKISLDTFIGCISTKPRKTLGIEVPTIALEEKAELTLFNPSIAYIFDSKTNKSLSNNSPYIGKELIGKAIKTFI